MIMDIDKVFAEKKVGKEYTVKGWVYRIRKMKDKIFIVVRDSNTILQIVVSNGPLFKDAEKLKAESSLIISGKLKAEEKAPGGFELEATNLQIVNIGCILFP